MFTGPVGPVEVFFYWPEVVFGNFYWPGAIGSPLASSPGPNLGKLLPSYGAIDCSRKQNGDGHWFLYLHIDGIILTVSDAKINTGKLFF